MKPVPETPMEALEIFCSPDSEEWERDYAAMMIMSLDEALPTLPRPRGTRTPAPRYSRELLDVWRTRGGTEECFSRQMSKVLLRSPIRKSSSSEVKDRHDGFDSNVRQDGCGRIRLTGAENPE